ncbi:MFS transporter [Acrocarpospora macrocephala]|uniref:MFS transporter n=1 Tax=Acrocarpospora macrocephala TaxID=150177 RepID=UPI0031D296E1
MSACRGKPSHHLTFAVLAVSVTGFALLQSLVTPVLSEIQANLHTDQKTVTWVLTGYLLAASICTPIVGRVGDRVGKKRVLVTVLVGLSIGSLVAGLATSIGPMIIGRVIQGVGGGVLPLAFGIVRDEFPERKIPGAVGILASLGAVGGGIGIVLAGPIVDTLGYHWLFWLPMIVTILAAIVAHAIIPESLVRTPSKISLLPALLLSTWLVCLLLALSQGGDWGWTSGRTIALTVASLAVAAAWVWVEKRSASPLIDMDMMRLPAVWTANSVALLVGFAMYAAYAFLPQFAQTPGTAGYGFGASITESGLILLPMAVTMFVVGLLSGTLVRLIGPKVVVVTGCLVSASSMAALALAHDEKWEHYLANAIIGVGVGLVLSCLSNLIVAAVPQEQTGVASGINANIRTIGGSIGAAVMAGLVTSSLLPNGLPREAGYTNGFLALAGAFVLAASVALLIPRAGRRGVEKDLTGEPEHPELGLVAAEPAAGGSPSSG